MNLGDIKCEVFCNQVPRTAENFLALYASGYYDSTVFHRNIKASWYKAATPSVPAMQGLHLGTKFADEFRESQGSTLCSAGPNSGPNVNGSRFFITYAKQPF
ncbi:Peptidyl-prolyl cis-trans isomerase CYP18-1 [Zea mays]|uniref:Peptidyl-prolyl cis-trans isomerase n=2 Tax=Zea mays TaxID=4577 RepID=A0A8J8XFS8_MAIZE|nr:hypothetical protein ZEAMMB73_Zm00001d047973 [Zea mays]AQL08183.1 hypothetical protein ZEAMMB73_Zm00001d047973 [Zea mays]AQL08184.1 hypothetical protein ZEAMMB73_Zm00001d047973 [Zea mays]AQL08185.1 hypothetical protein ZEAMMB73_Zm00001d047973 [Zea mays]PWZ07028.1 hypothetical protein Zm00014a_009790 [Zea mays]